MYAACAILVYVEIIVYMLDGWLCGVGVDGVYTCDEYSA